MHRWRMLREAVRRGALVLILLSGTVGQARGEVELISKADPIPDTNGHSLPLSTSANGRYVVVLSDAPNLAPGQVDRNASHDIFLVDRVAGTTTLLTHAAFSPGTAGSASPFTLLSAQISADGRYVAFATGADDLVPGDENFRMDVFLYDRVTASTTLISHASGQPGVPANGHSYEPRISGNGEYVVFLSAANNLVAGQTDPGDDDDVFLYHRPSGTLTLVSRKAGSPSTAGNGKSEAAEISGNGRFVVFTSTATDLVTGQVDANAGADPETGLETDVFLFEVASGAVSLVSRASGSPVTTANSGSRNPQISADGRWIAFASLGGNLIPGQVENGGLDAFLFDRVSGEMRLASHIASSPVTTGGLEDDYETRLSLSADGRYLAFASRAPNLVPGQVDTNQRPDVFVYDRVSGLTELVSHTRKSRTTATAEPAAAGSPRISADGRYIAYQSAATDLVPGQTDRRGANENDVFLYDRISKTNVLVSHTPRSLTAAAGGSFPQISRDGNVVFFISFATDLGEGQVDPNGFVDIFAYRRATAEVELLTRRDPDLPSVTPHGASLARGLSADGRYVLFSSQGSGLIPGQIDSNRTEDIFLRDRTTGKTTLLSRSGGTAVGGHMAVLSADGRFAVFGTFTAGPPTALPLQLYDRIQDRSILVNHAPGSRGRIVGFPIDPSISADGRYVAYTCGNRCILVPGQRIGQFGSVSDVFLFDRVTGTNTLVSHANDSPVTSGNANSYQPRISADGRFVAFTSQATNLVPGQNSPFHQEQVFVFDRQTGAIALVSHAAGSPTTGSNDDAQVAAISANGRWIVFVSNTSNVVAGQVDPDNTFDVFLHNRVSGQTSLVSHAAGSPLAASDGNAFAVSISANGRWIAFESTATNLVAGVTDTNGASDVFLFDRFSGAITVVSDPSASGAGSPRISANGSRIAYLRLEDGSATLVVYDRDTGASTVVSPVHGPIDSHFPFPPLTPWLSSDGREVLFSSTEPLVAGDLNEYWDVYLFEDDGGSR